MTLFNLFDVYLHGALYHYPIDAEDDTTRVKWAVNGPLRHLKLQNDPFIIAYLNAKYLDTTYDKLHGHLKPLVLDRLINILTSRMDKP